MKTEHKRPQIQFMKHDFFTPQVVLNADVYFYRWIFHNWQDEESIQILRAAIPALKKGARILINDGCLPVPGTGRRCEEKTFRYTNLIYLLLTWKELSSPLETSTFA
jgi:hypothetical protein